MPEIVVMSGIPASGKSTYVDSNMNIENYFVYSTDNYIQKMADDQGSTYDSLWSDNIKQATTDMNVAVQSAIANEKNILWDATNLTTKKRKGILSRVSKKYFKTCICFMPPFEKADWDAWETRIEGREGKQIPNFVRYNMMISHTFPTFDEGFNRIIMCNMYGETKNIEEQS